MAWRRQHLVQPIELRSPTTREFEQGFELALLVALLLGPRLVHCGSLGLGGGVFFGGRLRSPLSSSSVSFKSCTSPSRGRSASWILYSWSSLAVAGPLSPGGSCGGYSLS